MTTKESLAISSPLSYIYTSLDKMGTNFCNGLRIFTSHKNNSTKEKGGFNSIDSFGSDFFKNNFYFVR